MNRRVSSGSAIILVVGTFFFGGGQANAVMIFNTFGPGDAHSPGGFGLGSPGLDADVASQFTFSGTQSYALDTFALAVGLIGGTDQLDVWLTADAGDLPGTIIESFSFVDEMGPGGVILAGTSILKPILMPDVKYWLVATTPAADTEGYWCGPMQPTEPTVGMVGWRLGGGPWFAAPNYLPVFRMNGTPVSTVPAPGAIFLGAIGMALGGYLRRRGTL